MKILHVAAELYPLLKTGGLGDVIGALPMAQQSNYLRSEIRILIPGFPAVLSGVTNLKKIIDLNTFAGDVSLYLGSYQNLNIYIIDSPHLFNREGSPYHDFNLESYPDNYLRFGLLGWMACELACGTIDPNWKPEIVHAHDWHAGLACAYLHVRGKPALSVFTIHNLAYQGVFAANVISELRLPPELFQMQGVEFYGHISYLKAGIYYADHVTAVSPTYAKEITTFELGSGLHGLLQERKKHNRLTGILNGVDELVWDPSTDKALVANYTMGKIQGKAECKKDIQKKMKLPIVKEKILFGVVSRLTEQKGVDWILSILPIIIKNGGQLVLLGAGELWIQEALLQIADESREHVAVQIGYDDNLAHQIIAGADVLLVPSRFEPCGLTQLYALKYGTLPLVRYTGGLADTVVDSSPTNIKHMTATGFVFHGHDISAFEESILYVFELWQQKTIWTAIQKAAMKQNFGWDVVVDQYSEIYQKL